VSTKRPKALDLFCCAGGASEGLYRAGFDVVGVDIEAQPHYPFPFIQADAMTISVAGFDFVWASPPCQAYTLCQRIRDNEHPDLVEPTRKMLKASGVPWCIENVVGAPLIDPVELCGAMFGLRTYRHRLFECSFPIVAPPHPEHVAPLRKMGRPVRDGEFIHVVGNFSGVKTAREAMDIPWMPRDKLREAIPPAYAEYVGRAALRHMAVKTLAGLEVSL
jgi:DNA (cytosine-5)-methyltransferase 1